MSIDAVHQFTQELPFRLREDVLSYARSVNEALPEIFREANVAPDERLGDELVFVAGIKKLHAICSANFWILDSSLHSLSQADLHEVQLGSLRISRGSEEWQRLRDLLNDLEGVLAQQNLLEIIGLTSYTEILQWLRG